jgi:GTP-binding protein
MFATSTNQSPRYAQPGTPGESHQLRLELRLLADVGLVGFPNIGKSTLIARVSAARPRIADYPFTTIAPNLGVVRYSDDIHFVLADIPGLIEGAHEGHGLGHRFLRHISRTAILLHMIDAGGLSGRDPVDDFDVINRELRHFDPALADKPQIVAANKIDLLGDTSQLDEIRERFNQRGVELHCISAATGDGVRGLLDDLAERLSAARAAAREDEASADRDERTART